MGKSKQKNKRKKQEKLKKIQKENKQENDPKNKGNEAPESIELQTLNQTPENGENFDIYQTEEQDEASDINESNLEVNCNHIAEVNPEKIQNAKTNLFKSNFSCQSCLHSKKGKHKSKHHVDDPVWVCLTCGHSGCDRNSKNKHSMHHFEVHKHPIAVSPELKKVWCYRCDEYVSLGENTKSNPLRAALKHLGLLEIKEESTPQKKDNSSRNKNQSLNNKENGEVTTIKGIHGLENLGNTCFFNSVLQNLFNITPFQTSLLKVNSKGPLTVALIVFFRMMAEQKDRTLKPAALFKEIAKRAPRFNSKNQQDSHELLCYLMDGIDIEEKERLKSLNAPEGSQTILENIFGGKLSSTIICHTCKSVSTVYEKILDLSLPIPNRFIEEKKQKPIFQQPSQKKKRKPKSEPNMKKMSEEPEKEEEVERDQSPVSNNLEALDPELIPFNRPNLQDSSCTLLACINEFTKPEILDGKERFGCIECTKRELDQKGIKYSATTFAIEKAEEVKEKGEANQNEDKKEEKKQEFNAQNNPSWSKYSIRISEIHDYIQKAMFEHEYESIEDPDSGYTFESANANKIKNRYSNVLAPDASRVILKVQPDYINANYISGLIPGTERKYIATQGPLEDTTCDFWRMVWETNCEVILMLTKEIENSWIKCDRYYPLVKGRPFIIGEFTIEFLSEDATPELTRRDLLLKVEGQTSRNIYQLHYTEWPDHGLPVSTTHFLQLLHLADEFNKSNSPFIVHCSAGLGRSGVFCAVHSITEKIKYDLAHGIKDPSFNLIETVISMRRQRPAMIQTADQFKFCYLALAEAISDIQKKFKPAIEEINVPPESKPTTSESNSNTESKESMQSQKGSKRKKSKEKKPEKISLLKRCATKQFMIHEQPKILILHLKRFMQTSKNLEKITTPVSFPLVLEMNEYCDTNAQKTNSNNPSPFYRYNLKGIVSHSGSLNSGHYVAYVKKEIESESQWFYFSDTRFSKVKESDVLSQEAYLLFYERIDEKKEKTEEEEDKKVGEIKEIEKEEMENDNKDETKTEETVNDNKDEKKE